MVFAAGAFAGLVVLAWLAAFAAGALVATTGASATGAATWTDTGFATDFLAGAGAGAGADAVAVGAFFAAVLTEAVAGLAGLAVAATSGAAVDMSTVALAVAFLAALLRAVAAGVAAGAAAEAEVLLAVVGWVALGFAVAMRSPGAGCNKGCGSAHGGGLGLHAVLRCPGHLGAGVGSVAKAYQVAGGVWHISCNSWRFAASPPLAIRGVWRGSVSPRTMRRPIGTRSPGFQRSCALFSGRSFRSSRGRGWSRWGTILPVRSGWPGGWRCSAGSP